MEKLNTLIFGFYNFNVNALSLELTKKLFWVIIFPLSSFLVTKCTVQPVFLSLFFNTLEKTFKPLNFGSREG